ncbi:MAG: ABC-F family ATP-binding cassette domain-containing protein [Planctomycetota bacterium]|nr:ABC-F family ATP-binding cassette domain-containing protein [Planctomycetota bacterium]
MPLLTLAGIRHAFPSRTVLDGATLSVEPGEKIGLVGRNGAGKSTLLRIITSQLQPDHGSMQLARGVRIGHLSQHPEFVPGDTVKQAAARAFDALHAAQAELEQVYEAMASAEADELEKLMERQSSLDARIESLGGYAIEHKVDATLHGLGLEDERFDQPVDTLSGGQKARLGLARLLLESPDLLLLDEPTNHLDIHGRRWLENFLAEEFHGAVIVISHDRWLLDRVVERIVEVEAGRVLEYPGNYQAFIKQRHERKLVEQRVHEKQLDRIRAEEAFIKKYKAGQRAKQARGREARLERYKRDELSEKPIELEIMDLDLPIPPRSGDVLVAGEHLTKGFGDNPLFDDFSISIRPGDRIGVIGPNGAGKTTLIRSLLGDLEADAGRIRRSPRLAVGWFRQNQDHLDPDRTIWQYLQKTMADSDPEGQVREQDARNLAGAFLFSGAEQEKTIDLLSGGERARMVLAGLVASPMNLLVLDEPSNHLDIPSAERLERALVNYGDAKEGRGGALILISHDRALVEATCTTLIVFDGEGGVTLFNGRYSDWADAERRRIEADDANRAVEKEREKAKAKSSRKSETRSSRKRDSSRKSDSFSKLSLKELEKRIEATESRIREIDESMMDPKIYTDGGRTKELQAERKDLSELLEPLEFEWSCRAEES